MASDLSLEERFVGCLVGGACGDALGSAVEFKPYPAIVEEYGEMGIRTFQKVYDYPGAFTDDTQMTLFTAEGLLSSVLSVLHSNGGLERCQAEDAVPGLHQSYLRDTRKKVLPRFYMRQIFTLMPDGILPLNWMNNKESLCSAVRHLKRNARKDFHLNVKKWLATQNEVSQSPLFQEVRKLGMLMTRDKLRQRRGPGQTCRTAIKSGAVGSNENRINGSKGCGGIMRVAPCGLIVHSAFDFLSPDQKAELAFKLGCVSSAITHTHPSGWLSAGCQAAVIAWILSGESLESAIEKTIPLLEKEPENEETAKKICQARELAREFLESFGKEATSSTAVAKAKLAVKHIETLGRGFVGEEALGITLYCALICGEDVEDGICYAVNYSGDSDSTGAMTGNILGALFGKAAFPSKWTENVELGDLIREISRDLFSVRDSTRREELVAKYPPPVVIHQGEEYYRNKANLVTPPFKMPPGSKFFDWANPSEKQTCNVQ